ncbi:PREDICTED: testis-specific H1 histone [Dipodomys ordii]|uniref:Testis-specific H1 histone n=1 Tax=Dipodomys ordii TaxID=10020 RepID=A0A1S3FDP0_DIPOR|nr:PREDICTED: testis-specific H1 histone [Dipodomys ordii]
MAEAAEPSGEPQRADSKTQHSAEKFLGSLPRRDPRSVLRVSQLLLRAIGEHKGLTLAVLKRELGNAGYLVRKKPGRSSGDWGKPEVRGTLLRVSGSEAAGYFKVCKIPKGRKKSSRPKQEEANRWRRIRPEALPRRRHTHRQAAKKAREVWRCNSKVTVKTRRVKAKARGSVRVRAKEEVRAKVMDESRGRASKEDTGPERRLSAKVREERKPEPEKPGKKPIQKSSAVKSDCSGPGQGKVRSKSSVKSDSPRNAAENP